MKKIFLTLLILVFSVTAACSATIDKQIKTHQKNKKDIDKKIQQYNSIIKEKNKQSKSLLNKLNSLKKNANDSQEKITVLERENSKLDASINNLNKNIASINKDIKIILRMLRGRLTEMYKYSPPDNSLHLLLASENPHEALNTAYLLNRFAVQDQVMIDELIEKQNQLKKIRLELENDERKIQQQSQELKRKRAEFDNTIKQTDALLKDVQSEQKKAQDAAAELVAAQREVGNKINSLMKQKKAAQAKSTQTKIVMNGSNVSKTQSQPKIANKKSQSSKTANTQSNRSTPVAAYSGNAPKYLSWPINGSVSVPYGSRVHPTFKTKIFNSGIDIRAASGTPVKAAGAGEVLYQGWLKGFGQVVIIDHGGDLSTVYAHLSSTSVREGSVVNTGTVIGRVGNSGTESEYGLHFEVRKNGSAQNPLNFLRR